MNEIERLTNEMNDICKKISYNYALMIEKAIKTFIDYKDEEELAKYGERVFINKIMESNMDWQTIEFFKFKGERKFKVQQKLTENSIKYRIVPKDKRGNERGKRDE